MVCRRPAIGRRESDEDERGADRQEQADRRRRIRRRAHALSRFRRSRHARGARPLRSRARQGFLRRRIHRRHQGPQVAPDRRGRAHHPGQPRASRRGRRRSARRRRRRHPGADPAQVLRPQGQGARHHAAGARRIRHRRAVHAARRRTARARPQDLRGGRGARRPEHPRLALRHAGRQLDARRVGEADRAVPHAGFHRQGKKQAHRGRVRAQALHPAQVDLGDDLSPVRAAAVGLLPGVDLVPHGDLQGHVPRRPARHLLSRPAASRISRARWRWCTSASRPTPSRPGRWRIPTA